MKTARLLMMYLSVVLSCNLQAKTMNITEVSPINPETVEIRPLSAESDNTTFEATTVNITAATEIINTGLKVWKVISENQPVVNVTSQYATAIPKNVTHWQEMSGWRPPVATAYVLSAKNLLGSTVVNIIYEVIRTYGGSYQGHGQYLTGVTIQPVSIKVDWGYKVDLDASIPESGLVNTGSDLDPVAGLTTQVVWNIATPLKKVGGRSFYFLQGTGKINEIPQMAASDL